MVRAFMIFRSRRRFNDFIERVKGAAEKHIEQINEQVAKKEQEEPSTGKEISEFIFRDKMGVLTTVKIVIDHDLKNSIPDMNKDKIKSMVLSGEAGTLGQLLEGHSVQEDAMSKVQEFVFSPDAVRDMRAAGLEPDDVVAKMLKASGRM